MLYIAKSTCDLLRRYGVWGLGNKKIFLEDLATMNEKKEKKPSRWSRMSGDKKFYLFTAIGCAAVLVAVIVVAIAVSGSTTVAPNEEALRGSNSVETPIDSTPDSTPDDDPNKPVVTVPEDMVLPMEAVTVSNDYGFYHNKTLNTYYEHRGLDFSAAAGTEVKAVQSGTVESIYKEDLLSGTEIVIDHGDGLKTVYRFVTETEGLKVGDSVERGEVIATVAEATGNEYKDGPHLHFEVLEKGKQVDPTLHLTLEEK